MNALILETDIGAQLWVRLAVDGDIEIAMIGDQINAVVTLNRGAACLMRDAVSTLIEAMP